MKMPASGLSLARKGENLSPSMSAKGTSCIDQRPMPPRCLSTCMPVKEEIGMLTIGYSPCSP